MMFNIDLVRVSDALERIASALERLSPPITDSLIDPQLRKRGLESLVTYGDNNKLWVKENFQTLIEEQGLSPDQTREALVQALSEYQEDEEENPFMEPL
jgi:hypothetical protein